MSTVVTNLDPFSKGQSPFKLNVIKESHRELKKHMFLWNISLDFKRPFIHRCLLHAGGLDREEKIFHAKKMI